MTEPLEGDPDSPVAEPLGCKRTIPQRIWNQAT